MGFRNEGTAQRIAGAGKQPAVAERVVARILASNRWNDGFREDVSNGLISERVPIIPAKAGGPLTKSGSRISRLGSTGQRPRENKRGIVKTVLRGKPKLILDSQRRKLRIGADRAIVWNNPKDALRLLAFLIVLRRRARRGRHLRGLRLRSGFLLLCC